MEYRSFVERPSATAKIKNGLAHYKITAVLGPRQCGKTSLTKPLVTRDENLFDLHSILDRARLEDSNFKVLENLEGTVVIDEVQEKPELYQKLRVLADERQSNTRYLITGSASPTIIKGVSESLAGRVDLIPLGGFTIDEVGSSNWRRLWIQGGFPPSYLHELEKESMNWRLNYIDLFLRRDLPALAETKLTDTQLRRLFLFIASSHGQFLNHSSIAQQLGVNYKTVQRHIEIFAGAFILRELQQFHVNLQKRLRKAPKLYVRDSGLYHALLQIPNYKTLAGHGSLGFSWEGFGVEQVITLTDSRDQECFTWSNPSGPEVDLVLAKSQGPYGFEFKAGDAPTRTSSMITAVKDLSLVKLFVIYPGKINYSLGDKIEAVGIENLSSALTEVR
jgi:predicted AAA+ superfamily ATPase